MKSIIKRFITLLLAAAISLSMTLAVGAAYNTRTGGRNVEESRFTEKQSSWIAGHHEVSVGWLGDSQPYIYMENGTVTGAVAEYLRELADISGLKFTFTAYGSVSELNIALASGAVDIAAAFYYDGASAGRYGLLLSKAYYSANFAIISPQIENETAAGMTAFGLNGCPGYLKSALPVSDMLTCETDRDALDAVLSGEAGLAVVESYSAQALLRQSPYYGLKFKILGETYDCSFAAAEGNAELIDVLNTGIDSLSSSIITAAATDITVGSVDSYRLVELERSRLVYIVTTDFMCLVIVLLLSVYIFLNSGTRGSLSNSFLGICLAYILRFVSDATSNMADGRIGAAARAINWASNFLLLISTALIMLASCLFLYYLISERKKPERTVIIIGGVYAAVFTAAAVASQFNGMVYYISSANVYQRGWAIKGMFVFSGMTLLALCIWLTGKRKWLSRKELAALLISILLPALGVILQMLFPDISPSNAFSTMGMCAAFLSLQFIIFKSEHLWRVSSQSEVEGMGEIFTGVYRWDPETGRMESSVTAPEYASLLTDGTLDFRRFINEVVHPGDREDVRDFLSSEHFDMMNSSPVKLIREIELREIGAHDGEWRRISLIHLPVRPGSASQLYMVSQDITHEKKLAEHSAAQRRRLIGAAGGLYNDVCEWDVDNDTALRLIITQDGVMEKPISGSCAKKMEEFRSRKVMPEDYRLLDSIMPEMIKNMPVGSTANASFRVLTDGEYHWNSATVRVFCDGDGTKTAMYMQQDIDKSIREHDALRDRSEHDAMTDLFNRAKLDEMKKGEYSELNSCGVLFFDINNLKATNDTLGHDAGDGLIRLAAESIRSITNRRVMAYRIGGDEMLVVAADCTGEDLQKMIALWSIRLAELNKSAPVQCSVAMGSAWMENGADMDRLIKTADEAMYEEKKAMKEMAEAKNQPINLLY